MKNKRNIIMHILSYKGLVLGRILTLNASAVLKGRRRWSPKIPRNRSVQFSIICHRIKRVAR